ncbi:hypothetical protein E2562_019230 [Oryza meyeriana var. granulata]|uniref:Uncharacterized protein n=1 Tax=Oryza meyeriana var. granulata TaxID=110450 RepID=A0A6G1FAC1_9ORYZ|nr:hypothetical protein E2562_019230 [Oryza meyeriana var. granulata]
MVSAAPPERVELPCTEVDLAWRQQGDKAIMPRNGEGTEWRKDSPSSRTSARLRDGMPSYLTANCTGVAISLYMVRGKKGINQSK